MHPMDLINKIYGVSRWPQSSKPKMVQSILALIESGTYDLGIQNEGGYTALMWACYFDLVEVALALIKTGKSNPGAQCKSGFTALMNATRNGNISILEALIATGKSNPGARTDKGITALIIACWHGYTEKALLLLEASDYETIDAVDNIYYKTALDYAKQNNMFAVVWEITRIHAYMRRRYAVIYPL
jgi:ankyrin repeat protein